MADKSVIIAALHKWIAQRPGLEFGNYGDVSSYRSEMRSITRDLHHARAMVNYVAWHDSITAEMILSAADNGGRLTLEVVRDRECMTCKHEWTAPVILSTSTANLSGEATCFCPNCNNRATISNPQRVKINYVTGQYWPTEYRRAVCALMSSVIWAWLREDCNCKTGDDIRKAARRELGASIARRWFK